MTDPFDTYASYLHVLNSLVQGVPAVSQPQAQPQVQPQASLSSASSLFTPIDSTLSGLSAEEESALQHELSLWQSANFTQLDAALRSPTSTTSTPPTSSPTDSLYAVPAKASSPPSSSSSDALYSLPVKTSPSAALLEPIGEDLDFLRLAPEDKQHIVQNLDHLTAFALLDPCALPSQSKVPRSSLQPIAPSPYTRPAPSSASILPLTSKGASTHLAARGNRPRPAISRNGASLKPDAPLSPSETTTSHGPLHTSPPSALSAPLPNNKRKRTSPTNHPPLPTAKAAAAVEEEGGDDAIDDPLSLEEDKRRRNTAASARFRQKKKLREVELERTAQIQTDRADQYHERVLELEQEVKWLKSLLVEKDPSLLEMAKKLVSGSAV